MNNNSLKLKDIIEHLETIAPPVYQESYDNSGLLTGNPDWEIKSALVSIDCTEEIIEEAIQSGSNLVIAHHPIIFSGIKKLTGKNYVERTIIKAIKNDIAIYAIHTNLDNVKNGVNMRIADVLELKHTRVLQPKQHLLKKLITYVPADFNDEVRISLFEAGAGNIGNYDNCSFYSEGTGTYRGNDESQPFKGVSGEDHFEPEMKLEVVFPVHAQQNVIAALIKSHPYEEIAYDILSIENYYDKVGAGIIGELDKPMTTNDFLTNLKNKMKLGCIRYTDSNKKEIKTVAVCGGSGSFLLKNALMQQADAFITADFKYHDFFDAENRLMIADIGHYESEFFTKDLLKDIILKKFPTFAVLLAKTNTNPIKYF